MLIIHYIIAFDSQCKVAFLLLEMPHSQSTKSYGSISKVTKHWNEMLPLPLKKYEKQKITLLFGIRLY